MKKIFDNISEIRILIEKAGGAILLLDFDGVLSAIAKTPDEAFISSDNIELIKKCTRFFPVAVITGRTLEDIKKKIDIKDLFYIGSHGLEWEEDGKYHVKPIPKEIINAINSAKEKIKPLLDRYPGTILEDKSFMFALHYRAINPKLADVFIKEAMSILEPIAAQNNLRLDHSMKTIELRPEINWDKGNSAIFAEEYFNKKMGKRLIPIYIGDSLTDEDAFLAIREHGITIRIGKNAGSAAEWYIEDQEEVALFLKWLLSLRQ